ncbi:uncharacterized protein [Ptychodera flava]|uniref:uncharacterized protein n=1 Tax=Ptychodera flava TaxID=63121 RepID=UPI00396A4493
MEEKVDDERPPTITGELMKVLSHIVYPTAPSAVPNPYETTSSEMQQRVQATESTASKPRLISITMKRKMRRSGDDAYDDDADCSSSHNIYNVPTNSVVELIPEVTEEEEEEEGYTTMSQHLPEYDALNTSDPGQKYLQQPPPAVGVKMDDNSYAIMKASVLESEDENYVAPSEIAGSAQDESFGLHMQDGNQQIIPAFSGNEYVGTDDISTLDDREGIPRPETSRAACGADYDGLSEEYYVNADKDDHEDCLPLRTSLAPVKSTMPSKVHHSDTEIEYFKPYQPNSDEGALALQSRSEGDRTSFV